MDNIKFWFIVIAFIIITLMVQQHNSTECNNDPSSNSCDQFEFDNHNND